MHSDNIRSSTSLTSLLLLLLASSTVADEWIVRHVKLASYEGAFVEYCLSVPEDAVLEVEMSVPHPVDFNVHYHTDTETLFPVRERVEGDVTFSVLAERAGEYCVMWTNPEARQERTLIETRYRAR